MGHIPDNGAFRPDHSVDCQHLPEEFHNGLDHIRFIGLTAWDTQQIKAMALQAPAESAGRISTYGALSLYLDFINLFLYLLRFFGSSRD